MKAEKQSHTSNSEEQFSLMSRSLFTGLVGGIALGCAWCILYYFNFSEISPKSFVLNSWIDAKWVDTWLGDLITILIVGLLSMVAALIYHCVFKKIYSMWMGVVYGIILWGIIFVLVQPIFTNVPNITDSTFYTNLSTISLFILYGTFIGFSISFDYYDLKVQLRKQSQE
ncbi:YqhR family membrane protein [Oceanobacillus polygoni]|uniref:Membrane protein n=1 Tax=Oceanobacillus polygoni TaxID=1235259 RepID=A0A9X0YSM3_9BACI|nr:YqhR family membrane protein [Oceanobacillus polygoni]MBP2078218.1 putative membrane protein [Oceanobacillus polygoni]